MTYLHFLNCLSLTFGPLIITYQSSNLSEINGYASLVSIFFYYLIFQGIKLFILACLPFSVEAEFSILVEIFRILTEILANSIGIIYCHKNASYQ